MTETDNVLWTQIFQDKPISQAALENFQTQIMARIEIHPVDFGEKIRLAKRRKWGLWLALSLMVVVFAFGVFLWLESDLVCQVLNVVLVKLLGLPYASELQQVERRVLRDMLLFRELRTGLGLLWGVVSWPILGMLSAIVILRSEDPVCNRKPSI